MPTDPLPLNLEPAEPRPARPPLFGQRVTGKPATELTVGDLIWVEDGWSPVLTVKRGRHPRTGETRIAVETREGRTIWREGERLMTPAPEPVEARPAHPPAEQDPLF